MGLGNLGGREIFAMLLVLGVIVLVPVGMIVWVARWIARRNANDLAARVARLEVQAGMERETTDGGPRR